MITATYTDVEEAAVDLLESLLASREPSVTVGVGVPEGWTQTWQPHISVAVDGAFMRDHPVAGRFSIRVTARASSTGRAKELASLAFGLLCGHDGSPPFSSIRPLAGPLPARDPDTRAELASASVTALVRSTQLF